MDITNYVELWFASDSGKPLLRLVLRQPSTCDCSLQNQYFKMVLICISFNSSNSHCLVYCRVNILQFAAPRGSRSSYPLSPQRYGIVHLYVLHVQVVQEEPGYSISQAGWTLQWQSQAGSSSLVAILFMSGCCSCTLKKIACELVCAIFCFA
jgi:hypothetical protein